MPAASPLRQPKHPLAWFDTAQGSAMLADEHGLLMPLLVRCPGDQVCRVLPTAQAVAHAPPMLMPNETRWWCDQEGWHGSDGRVLEMPALAAHSIDLVVATHSIATLPEPRARLAAIHRMLVPGGSAFFLEFNPFSPYRRHWHGHGLSAMSLRRLRALAVECGFGIEASYALRPRASADSSGMLLRHNWRLPSWLPLRVYALRVRKREPGMTLIGKPMTTTLMQAPNA